MGTPNFHKILITCLGMYITVVLWRIPDALRLLEMIDLEGMIVTGGAMFCQKTITSRIVEKGGEYLLPVKENQKDLREEITAAFREPVSPSLNGRTRPKQGMDPLTCATSTCCLWTRSPNTCAPYGRRFAQVPASRAAVRMSGPEI